MKNELNGSDLRGVDFKIVRRDGVWTLWDVISASEQRSKRRVLTPLLHPEPMRY
jgi:hypothetical protein